MKIYRSYSSAETKKFGKKLAQKALKSRQNRQAIIVALEGELGAGKTTFIQGFFNGLGLKKRAVSPTFILMRRIRLKSGDFPPRADQPLAERNIFHIDAYRLKSPKAILALDFKEIISNPENIVLIEWADKIKKFLPKSSIWLKFEHGKKEKERVIKIYE